MISYYNFLKATTYIMILYRDDSLITQIMTISAAATDYGDDYAAFMLLLLTMHTFSRFSIMCDE